MNEQNSLGWVKNFKDFLKYVLNDNDKKEENGKTYNDDEIYKIIICCLLFFNEKKYKGENILETDKMGFEMLKEKAVNTAFDKYKKYFY